MEETIDHYQKEMDRVLGNGPEKGGDGWAIACGLAMVADAIKNASYDLGSRNAATPMGALEMLAKEIHDGARQIAGSMPSGPYAE